MTIARVCNKEQLSENSVFFLTLLRVSFDFFFTNYFLQTTTAVSLAYGDSEVLGMHCSGTGSAKNRVFDSYREKTVVVIERTTRQWHRWPLRCDRRYANSFARLHLKWKSQHVIVRRFCTRHDCHIQGSLHYSEKKFVLCANFSRWLSR